MGKETLEGLIEKIRPQFKDNNMVAFLGEVKSGKTVVASLFNYHLSKVWIPQSKGAWESVPVTGDEAFFEIVRRMKKGIFTDSTSKNDYPKLVIDVYSMEGTPVKTQLTLHDISGETYVDLLSREYTNEEERLTAILSGDGAYLAFAKQYVIMVGCDLYDNWDTDIAKVARMIRSIQKIKQTIHKLDSDEVIHAPIAVVFTKSDTLKPKNQQKSPEELLDDYPGLQSSLNVTHDRHSLACFKVHVVSDQETKTDATQRVKKLEDELHNKFKQKMDSLKQQIDAIVEQAVNTAETQARASGQGEDAIKLAMDNARQNTLEQNQNLLNEEEPKLPNREEELKQTWKVRIPFTYSGSEYSKLISWILTSKHNK